VSKYLHFGQLSPLYIALELRKQGANVNEQVASYLDELLIRRELTYNFVYYTPDYDKYSCLPDWVQKTLDEHRADVRPHRYTFNQLEAAQTHDPYWNAAMLEMKTTGYMHNYMRMYWGKKILEWCKTPEAAYATALTLNNKYFLDGRDPNSYGNVGWIFGLHDRSWGEREIFGKVRFLSASGLERKSDIDAYVEWVKGLAAKAASTAG
jgi:deoxyribodipyrimidine photo-lyase